ncbi:MAG: hypothetical protein JWM98_218 [Thermoleophilia bacterium]|nr:hypothetical protein [Thermoleophilia bacterium]
MPKCGHQRFRDGTVTRGNVAGVRVENGFLGLGGKASGRHESDPPTDVPSGSRATPNWELAFPASFLALAISSPAGTIRLCFEHLGLGPALMGFYGQAPPAPTPASSEHVVEVVEVGDVFASSRRLRLVRRRHQGLGGALLLFEHRCRSVNALGFGRNAASTGKADLASRKVDGADDVSMAPKCGHLCGEMIWPMWSICPMIPDCMCAGLISHSPERSSSRVAGATDWTRGRPTRRSVGPSRHRRKERRCRQCHRHATKAGGPEAP